MDDAYLNELMSLVTSGDFGAKAYKLSRVNKKLPASKDRNVFGPFSWTKAVETKAPALLFRDACNSVAGCRGYNRLPDDPHHLLDMLRTSNIRESVYQCAEEEAGAGWSCLADQVSVELPKYYSKLRFDLHEAYAYKPEYWLQAGNRESPLHVDHARVVSYIPPCARYCFKVWVFFQARPTEKFNWGNKEDSFNRMLDATTTGMLVQQPGDVVCLSNLVYHSVLLGYRPGTPLVDRWGGIFGDVIVRREDRVESFQYATKTASGSQKDSEAAWKSLLSAYCVMEGRVWSDDSFEEEKERFLATLPLSETSAKMLQVANAKWDKKRQREERMKKVRAAKKSKEG